MEDKTNTIFYTLNHGLYKSDFNGENPKRLADNVTSYQYADGWLYFNRYGTLVRLNSDTSAEEEVMSFSSFAFNVNGAYVYYTDGYSVYRYKIGTTDEPKMLNIEPYNEDKKFETIHVLPSGIYLNQQETGWAYRLTFDGHFINFMGLDHTEEQKN